MMQSYHFEIIGYIAGICTAVCFMPQSIKTIMTKDVRSLSLWSYVLYNLGILCWIIYGFYINSVQMVVFNAISIFFAGVILFMILKYKNKRGRYIKRSYLKVSRMFIPNRRKISKV